MKKGIADKGVIYMDNNAISVMSPKTISEMVKWCNKGNPSASYSSAKECAALIDDFKARVAQHINAPPDKMRIILTSGATESNNTIIKSVQRSYNRAKGKPHFIAAAVEHSSVLDALDQLKQNNQIDLDIIAPQPSGCMAPDDFIKKIKHNTALIICMHANNETGAINDIAELTRMAHARNVPVFSDMVQTFGRHPIDWNKCDIDAFSVSFHKFGGCAGCGVLGIREEFLCGYHIEPLICGSQNDHLRGGTENVPGIAACRNALMEIGENRKEKNEHIWRMKKRFLERLSKVLTIIEYTEFVRAAANPPCKDRIFIVLLSPRNSLMNTILLAVYDQAGVVCNAKLKAHMEQHNVIVSIGSACNTNKKNASHVLYAMKCDDLIKRGTIRISLYDGNTEKQVDAALTSLIKSINYAAK